MIRVVAVGRKHEDWVEPGISRYEKRLRQPWNVRWDLVPHSSLREDLARSHESEALLSRLNSDDFVILLDEIGKSLDSPALSNLIEDQFNHSKTPCFVVGGAYGVDERLHKRADMVLSLSKLVLPHQLVRLVLIEQIYRAEQIAKGSDYHHK
ncbi:23S rRNA (pseudouridine(1915)-N(3))-methyltransferase RlmH [Candidatus Nomurabacteria bacterium]|nr:23S rRNA (pseudouridine(1915)-N(3))-methyltransferase RlmH [Candidatus Nomurabacteria bacterium]